MAVAIPLIILALVLWQSRSPSASQRPALARVWQNFRQDDTEARKEIIERRVAVLDDLLAQNAVDEGAAARSVPVDTARQERCWHRDKVIKVAMRLNRLSRTDTLARKRRIERLRDGLTASSTSPVKLNLIRQCLRHIGWTLTRSVHGAHLDEVRVEMEAWQLLIEAQRRVIDGFGRTGWAGLNADGDPGDHQTGGPKVINRLLQVPRAIHQFRRDRAARQAHSDLNRDVAQEAEAERPTLEAIVDALDAIVSVNRLILDQETARPLLQ